MSKPFAASALRAYAPSGLANSEFSVDAFTDASPRGLRGSIDWPDGQGASLGVRGDLLNGSGLGWRMPILQPADAATGPAAEVPMAVKATPDPGFAAQNLQSAGPQTSLLDDIADDSSTTYALDAQEGDSVHSQLDAPGDQDWFSTHLSAGQTYKFTLTPDDSSENPPGDDMLIEIYNSAGVLQGSFDSGSFGAAEVATFTATVDDTYYIAVKQFTPADIGGYTLTAEIDNSGGATGGTPLAAINWGGDANVVDTGNYTVDGKLIIKVYFSQTGDLPYGTPDDPVVGVTWDSWAKEGAFDAFHCYENIINVVFEEVFTRDEADFIMAASPNAPVILGRMRPPGEENEGLGEFNILASTWTEEGTAQGGYMWITFVHELGHAMGMAHPHDTGGGSEVMHGVTGDLATGYTLGDFDLNQGIWTTMSYNDGWQTAPHGNSDSDAYGYQGTLMALDVAMLQIKYGANATFNATDTVYALPTVDQPGTFYACIWDTGGTDWIIAGAGVDVTIDLRPATLQYEYGGGGWVSYAAGIHGGFTIANGVVIENAAGGAGKDTLIGNGAANWLLGGLDDDSLNGGDGDDRLDGGTGNDTLTGGLGFDTADYTSATAGVTVVLWKTGAQATGGAGTDVLAGIEALIGSAFADSLTGTVGVNLINGGAGNDTIAAKAGVDTLSGGDGADKIYGEGDDDILNGDDGDDTLTGGLGADQLNGGAGTDLAYYGLATSGVGLNLLTGVHAGEAAGDSFSSIEKFRLSTHDDSFVGSDAAEISVEGLDGNDSLDGAGGDDLLRGGAGMDSLQGGEGADRVFGDSGADSVYGGNGADLVYGGADNDVVYGDDGSDSLYGEAGDDMLSGGLGDDVLYGGAGADQFMGGGGFDLVSYRYVSTGITLNLATGANTGEAAGDTFDGVERFFLSEHGDDFTGGAADDRIEGLKGDDILRGGLGADSMNGAEGIDTLFGDDGNDSLYGGAANDVLAGGAGVDKLLGEAGDDTLTGGAGKDQFYYRGMGFGSDTVTDFENGIDKIRVVGVSGWDSFSDVDVSSNGSGWAVITFPDGSTITLAGVAAAQVDAGDFLWG